MLQRQRDISGATAVMKGHWTMTRPSRLPLEWPLSSFLPSSRSTSLSRWHFGKSHCHTTFNKDKSLRRAAGDDWPDRATGQSIPHVLRVRHWESGVGANHRQDTLVALDFLSFSLFLSLPGYSVYTHSTSPLTIRRLLPPCCQRSPGWNKRGGERGLRFLNQRKLVLITLLLKKHSDPVNAHTRRLPTPNHVAKDGESKRHTTPP